VLHITTLLTIVYEILLMWPHLRLTKRRTNHNCSSCTAGLYLKSIFPQLWHAVL